MNTKFNTRCNDVARRRSEVKEKSKGVETSSSLAFSSLFDWRLLTNDDDDSDDDHLFQVHLVVFVPQSPFSFMLIS